MPRAGDMAGMDPVGRASGLDQDGARYPLQGRHVCPFCGSVNETMEGPCPQCTMANTAETRKATKSRIGPWYVLQSRNPAAPGMKYQTLLGFVRKGRVKGRSIVRGPTTHQLWRFACQVKGLSREFGVCYSCGGGIERDAQLCPQCNRLQDPPAEPDLFLEGQAGGAVPDGAAVQPQGLGVPPAEPRDFQQDARRSPIFRELTLPPAPDFSSPSPRGAAPAVPNAADAASRSVFEDLPAPETPAPAPAPGIAPTPAAPSTAPQRPAAAAGSPAAAPPAASTPLPPKRNANDVFLSAKDLAAAFQLGFDGDADDEDDNSPAHARGGAAPSPHAFDPEAPWANDAPVAARPARSPRRGRRKRRVGGMLLLLVLLAAGAFAGYLAIDGVFRRRVFDWAEARYMALTGANLYPDLATQRKTADGGTAAPSAPAPDVADRPDATDPDAAGPGAAGPGAAGPDTDGPAPATVVPRRSPPPATLPAPPATQAASGLIADGGSDINPAATGRAVPPPARPDVRVSAATQPASRPAPQPEKKPDDPPRPTREQNLRKSAELWKRALEAEEAGDYRKAKATYEEIMSTLPKDVWYQGVETRLRVVKAELGEK